jgi:Na+/H+-dicarboxylate symporter
MDQLSRGVPLIVTLPIPSPLAHRSEALTLLIAVFTVPDIIDTSANVTADLAVTSLISRWTGGPLVSE